MAKESKEVPAGAKTCFVIAPIGPDGSDIRLRSDQVFKHIVAPSARECGYEPIRADHISEPGMITSQIIQHVLEDPLVIADLTGKNPNVFYELALRHAVKRPVVQIIHATETIPFDVAASRTVHVDHHNLDSVAAAKEEIVRQIRSVERNPADADSPISVAVELQALRKSENPLDKSFAEILTSLQDIKGSISEIRDEPRRMRMHPELLDDLMMSYSRAMDTLTADTEKPLGPEQVEHIRHSLRRMLKPLEIMCMESGLPPEFIMKRFRGKLMR